MSTPFAPWANSVFILAIVSIVFLAAAAVAAPMVYIRTIYGDHQHDLVEQPVEFDHRHHVRDDGIGCLYCHQGAATASEAGFPATEVCMGCHNQVWPQSPELEPVRASYFTDTPIPWKRVYDLPGFVYFHHGVHVSADIACAVCHGDVERMARVYRAVALTMEFCLECHDKVSEPHAVRITSLTTCTACHR